MEMKDNKGEEDSESTKNCRSAQYVRLSLDEILKPQLSAPFYLHCFSENQAPPFNKPVRCFKPKLLIGLIVEENDVLEIICAINSNIGNQFIGDYLLKKNIVEKFQKTENKFLISLMLEVIDYAAQRDFSAFKLACLLNIYISAHEFFKSYYWNHPENLWNYFKEVMIKHTIEDSVDGLEVFSPEECYDILTHFHIIYLSNLPLVHILMFGSPRLKFVWPYKK